MQARRSKPEIARNEKWCVSETTACQKPNRMMKYFLSRRPARSWNPPRIGNGTYRKQKGAYRKPHPHVSETQLARIGNWRVSETAAYWKRSRIGNGMEHIGNRCTRIRNSFCAYQKPPRVGSQPLSETRLDILNPDATLLEFRPSCRHAHQNLSLRVTKKKRDTNAHRILALLHPT